ncbi:hypothetical protein AOLI_G00296110 [Acnodon oligacanthus]
MEVTEQADEKRVKREKQIQSPRVPPGLHRKWVQVVERSSKPGCPTGNHTESQGVIASVPPVLLPAHCMLTLIQLPGDLGDNSGSQCSLREQGLATAPFDPDLNCIEDRLSDAAVTVALARPALLPRTAPCCTGAHRLWCRCRSC